MKTTYMLCSQLCHLCSGSLNKYFEKHAQYLSFVREVDENGFFCYPSGYLFIYLFICLMGCLENKYCF